MLKQVQFSDGVNNVTLGTHIKFYDIGHFYLGKYHKTNIYEVLPIGFPSETDLNILGTIRWFGRWRKYCFFPASETVYEETCLGEIAEFCVRETKNHRLKKKEERTDERRD